MFTNFEHCKAIFPFQPLRVFILCTSVFIAMPEATNPNNTEAHPPNAPPNSPIHGAAEAQSKGPAKEEDIFITRTVAGQTHIDIKSKILRDVLREVDARLDKSSVYPIPLVTAPGSH